MAVTADRLPMAQARRLRAMLPAITAVQVRRVVVGGCLVAGVLLLAGPGWALLVAAALVAVHR